MVCCCEKGCMNAFCASLEDGVRHKLCAAAHAVTYQAKERIAISSIGKEAAIVRQGMVAARVDRGDTGRLLMSYIGIAGDVMNIMRIAGDTRMYSAEFNEADIGVAVKPTQVCLVPLSAMRALLSEHSFAIALVSQLTDRYKDALERMYQSNYASAEEKIRWFLAYLETRGINALDLTHEEMALALGMNRVTVTKALAGVLGGNIAARPRI